MSRLRLIQVLIETLEVYRVCFDEDIQQGKRTRGAKSRKTPSQDYVEMICRVYGDVYDDREEDSKIKGLDWDPGVKASHKSMAAFQKELEKVHGIHLSRTKLQKILITGGCWITERSREIQWLFEEYTANARKGGKGMKPNVAIKAIAQHLEISTVSVIINLPYEKVVYDLENKSVNARRIEKCRAKKKQHTNNGLSERRTADVTARPSVGEVLSVGMG